MADPACCTYVFVNCDIGFAARLRAKLPHDPPLHYVARTTGTYDAFLVLRTDTPERADRYVAEEVAQAGGSNPLTCHAQRTSPNMLKYKAQKDTEKFIVVTPKPGQADALFDRINDPKGSPLATHAGSATVDADGEALVLVGLASVTAAGTDDDETKLGKMAEVEKKDPMRRSAPPEPPSSA